MTSKELHIFILSVQYKHTVKLLARNGYVNQAHYLHNQGVVAISKFNKTKHE